MPTEKIENIEIEKLNLTESYSLISKFSVGTWAFILTIQLAVLAGTFNAGYYWEYISRAIFKPQIEPPPSLPIGSLPPQASITLADLFGKSTMGQPRVQLLSERDNEHLLNDRLRGAQSKIRIVTLRGNWITGNQEASFSRATQHVSVEILMLDFKDAELYKMVQEEIITDRQGKAEKTRYAEALLGFAKYIKDGKDLKVGVTDFFPLTRFTIFDDKAVSFILTPGISGGPGTPAFFTEDSLMVDAYKHLYERIRARAILFDSLEAAEEYINRR